MAADLFEVLVDGVAATDEQADAAVERARAMTVDHLLDGETADEVVEEIMRMALVASLQGLADQMSTAADMVREEAAALKREDPTKVKAITSLAVANRRVERANGRVVSK